MEKRYPNIHTNKSKLPRLKIMLKLIGKDGEIITYRSSKTRRIFSILKHENFLEGYIHVGYGKFKDALGKSSKFSNDGIYKNKKDLIFALFAFTERSLVDYLANEGSN